MSRCSYPSKDKYLLVNVAFISNPSIYLLILHLIVLPKQKSSCSFFFNLHYLGLSPGQVNLHFLLLDVGSPVLNQ